MTANPRPISFAVPAGPMRRRARPAIVIPIRFHVAIEFAPDMIPASANDTFGFRIVETARAALQPSWLEFRVREGR